MANLDGLKKEVEALDPNGSLSAFPRAFRKIVDAVVPGNNVDELITIIKIFRSRLPSDVFGEISAKAKALLERLTLQGIAAIFETIKERNNALSSLTLELTKQIDGKHKEANLLKDIRTALGKADSTISAITNLVKDLKDANLKETITAFLKAADNIASTFAPDGPKK